MIGFLYIQYPKYMVTKKSTTMMDEMFASRFLDYKSRVLRVFLDFLVGEEKRIIDREKGKHRIIPAFWYHSFNRPNDPFQK